MCFVYYNSIQKRCFKLSAIDFQEVFSTRSLVVSVIIGTPAAIVGGAVAAVALTVFGAGTFAYSLYDPCYKENAKDAFSLAEIGRAHV